MPKDAKKDEEKKEAKTTVTKFMQKNEKKG